MQKILFSDKFNLNQAVLNLTKTCTRRFEQGLDFELPPCTFVQVRKPDNFYSNKCTVFTSDTDGIFAAPYTLATSRFEQGEEVAIAQSYNTLYQECVDKGYHEEAHLWKRLYENKPGWNNKMFVKPEDMPRRLKIIDINAEHLQDISGTDCLSEGIKQDTDGKYFFTEQQARRLLVHKFDTPRKAFAALIDKVGGRGTWERNQLIFAYYFQLITKSV